ncbi:hypothetical protein TRP8649_02112 [Pelagimonas phthalicica]|uniref:Uncharacterized protein n=1 Tax=Pelagimonas phthalicica TaxID=1037362 RepID=A0A238JBC7_9RHOB|nr:hypothetical protein [Pelagimonas phthalicica]TDS90953.1 hypothetical protein CLV87_2114 [Pelagimonas phthalicica]SMX28000.1 hypothetical protein TRP8649_02112 [Pelagimonas phthalicica]
MEFFEPSPVLLGFLFYKKFLFLPLLAALALIRVAVGHGIARWPALIALFLSAGGIATTFAPAAGLAEGELYVAAAQFMAEGGGMAALLVPAAFFLICSITPRARWRWLDVIHIVLLLILLGLWWWTS